MLLFFCSLKAQEDRLGTKQRRILRFVIDEIGTAFFCVFRPIWSMGERNAEKEIRNCYGPHDVEGEKRSFNKGRRTPI